MDSGRPAPAGWLQGLRQGQALRGKPKVVGNVTGLASLQQKRFTGKSGGGEVENERKHEKRRERKKVAGRCGEGKEREEQGLRTEVRQPLPIQF